MSQEHEIMARTNVEAELGNRVRWAGDVKPDGWRACYAVDRDEQNPSAAINVAGENGQRGRYKDSASGEKTESFFDLTVRLGLFPTWRESRKFHAAKAGIVLTNGHASNGATTTTTTGTDAKPSGSLWSKVEHPSPGGPHDALAMLAVNNWVTKKIGVDPNAVIAAGARRCIWPRKIGKSCVMFPAYLSAGDVDPHALLLFLTDGEDFAAFKNLPQRRHHLVGGSVDSLIIVGGWQRLAEAHTVWKFEGPTDALTWGLKLSAGHVAITNVCGAGSWRDEFTAAVAGKAVYIVHDADVAGRYGGKRIVASIFGTASEVRHVHLPYEFNEHHGKDARDFFNDGHTIADLLALAEATTPETAESAGPPPAKTQEPEKKEPLRFTRITSKDLAASVYQIEYFIERVLVGGQPCIFAGSKKTLKTTLLVEMGVTLSGGLHFLGKFKVPSQRRVLIMSGESGIGVLQETANRICKWHDCQLADLDNLLWSTDLPQVGQLDHLAALGEMLREDEVEVLIIDPAYLCIPSDDTANLFAMGAMLGNLSRTCQDAGVTLVLAHHTRKGNIIDPFEPPELEHVAFAGFQEFCRQWILVGRREAYEHGTGSHKLWLSVGGSAGHSGLYGCDIEEGQNTAVEGRTFDCSLMSAESVIKESQKQKRERKEAGQRDKDAGNRERLLRLMTKHLEGGTRNNIREWLGLNGANANRIIDDLLKTGELVECEIKRGCRKQTYAGVRLSDAEHARQADLTSQEQHEQTGGQIDGQNDDGADDLDGF